MSRKQRARGWSAWLRRVVAVVALLFAPSVPCGALGWDHVSDEEVWRAIRSVPVHYTGWTCVQSPGTQVSATASAVNLTVTSTTGGNLYVVLVGTGTNAGTVTVSDTKSNTYVQAGTYIANGVGKVSIWYAYNTTGGVTTVTVTPSTTLTVSFAFHEYSHTSGSFTSDPLDAASASGTGNSTSPSTGSMPVNNSGELAIACHGYNGVPTSWTAGTGFTARYSGTGAALKGFFTEDDFPVSSAVTGAATVAPSGAWESLGASFKAPAAAGTTVPMLALMGVGL